MVYVRTSKDNLWESVVSFQYVGLEAQAQFGKLGGKHLYLLSHISLAHSVLGNDQMYKQKKKAPDNLTPKSVSNLQLKKARPSDLFEIQKGFDV